MEHLLKVACSVARDADHVWAELWSEFKRFANTANPGHGNSGQAKPENVGPGFVPSGGWEAFLEKFWLLKHYLDSIQRISGSSKERV